MLFAPRANGFVARKESDQSSRIGAKKYGKRLTHLNRKPRFNPAASYWMQEALVRLLIVTFTRDVGNVPI